MSAIRVTTTLLDAMITDLETACANVAGCEEQQFTPAMCEPRRWPMHTNRLQRCNNLIAAIGERLDTLVRLNPQDLESFPARGTAAMVAGLFARLDHEVAQLIYHTALELEEMPKQWHCPEPRFVVDGHGINPSDIDVMRFHVEQMKAPRFAKAEADCTCDICSDHKYCDNCQLLSDELYRIGDSSVVCHPCAEAWDNNNKSEALKKYAGYQTV